MNQHTPIRLGIAAGLLASTALTSVAQDLSDMVKIGETTALIAEASMADEASEMQDGQSGNTNFPFLGGMKALATVGEVDPETGLALTGYPDGNAAWLSDEDTITVAYQSESYATMSNETYGWEMASGVTFTGSQLHEINYDRQGFAEFLTNDLPASEMFKSSGHAFDTIYNVFGDEVMPKAEGGLWGNQSTPDRALVDFHPDMQLSEGEFFFQSFCGAWYEPADKWGDGVGFADDVWLMAEEWNIQSMFQKEEDDVVSEVRIDANETMGLASIVVDLENDVAYTAPALGQTGYEKIAAMNPQHPDYVIAVLAGYNHELEPAPLKIYVGMKGKLPDGSDIGDDANQRDLFLAANGLLYGKIYGMAVANETYADLGIENVSLDEKMMDAYMTDMDAPDTFEAAFVPTSYQWGGWDQPVAVGETEMRKWGMPEEQPEGHTFFVGDSKTEHPAIDPSLDRTRYVQNLTQEGGLLGFDFARIVEELNAADGDLPAMLTATATRILPAIDGSLTLEVADAGAQPEGTSAATWEDGTAKTNAPDGLYWLKASNGDVLILDEDSGNAYGERKIALPIDADTMMPVRDGVGYFLAMAGGEENPRAKAGVSALAGAFSSATTAEFSGSWPVTSLVTAKEDGSFYTMDEIAGTGWQEIGGNIPMNEQTLIGVVQMKGESGGQVAAVKADQGGQIFVFNLNLPDEAYDTAMQQ